MEIPVVRSNEYFSNGIEDELVRVYIKMNYGRYQIAVLLDCPGNIEEVILGFYF